MRRTISALAVILLALGTSYAAWTFYSELEILKARAKLGDDVAMRAAEGRDDEVIRSAAAYFALKPRNPSPEMEQHLLDLYRAALWRWLLKDPRATAERGELELAKFEATEESLKQVRDE